LGQPCKFRRVSRLSSVTARYSSSGCQPNSAALNRGRHLYWAERPSRWALATFLVYLFKPFYRELTYRSDASTDFHADVGSNDADSRKDVPFLGFVDSDPHVGGKIPKNRNFGGVNRHFPAKLAKSKNMHIIKTTGSIPTKFCTAIKTIKCPS